MLDRQGCIAFAENLFRMARLQHESACRMEELARHHMDKANMLFTSMTENALIAELAIVTP